MNYEFGDITFPYTFQNNTDYQLVFHARISGDPKYESSPLVAVFDISAVNAIFPAGFYQLIIYYVIITSIILVEIIVVVILVVRRSIYQLIIMDIASSS